MYYDSRGKKPEICLTGQSCVSKAAFLSGGAKGKSSFFPFFLFYSAGSYFGLQDLQSLLQHARAFSCGM